MIGVRFSLYPLRDDFVPTIMNAVNGLDRFGVEVETDNISTCLLGEEPRLFEAIRVAFGRASRDGTHVALTATFSAGCPGEPEGDICVPRAYDGPNGGEEGWAPEAYDLPERVAAQFALYPLGTGIYMETIYDEIARAKQSPTTVIGRHFCTHLDGRGNDVFAVLRDAFASARRRATHTVMTVTLSAHSPSHTR